LKVLGLFYFCTGLLEMDWLGKWKEGDQDEEASKPQKQRKASGFLKQRRAGFY
jgi:hypothetical protein